jgi:hypothetical protein
MEWSWPRPCPFVGWMVEEARVWAASIADPGGGCSLPSIQLGE